MSQIVEALITLPMSGDPQITLDGSRVAFVKSSSYKADKDSPATGAIYMVEVTGGQIRRFAGDNRTYTGSPRWSPDGTQLAFVSDRANRRESQLYVLPLNGGEAERITDLRGRVRSPVWLSDSSGLIFLSAGIVADKAADPPDPVVQDQNLPFTRVWLTNLDAHTSRPITPSDLNVYEYAISADGKFLALIAASEATNEAWYYAQVYVTEIVTGSTRQVCQTPDQIGRPVFSPDGAQLAFISGILSDEGGVAGDIYVVPVSGGIPHVLTPNIDHSPLWLDWRTEGILYGARHMYGSRLGMVDPISGALRTILDRSDSIGGRREQPISVARDGHTFVTLIDGFAAPPNLYLGDLIAGRVQPLTEFESPFVAAPVESVAWKSTDGLLIQGYLTYPIGYQSGQRYPLIVVPHGGPSSSQEPSYGTSAWRGWQHWATQHGCAIFMPNPRGSWGRGQAFQAANVGDLGGGDWQDIHSGIDHLIAQGIADPDRLAIAGWSYGGYLTAWAITQTDRFRCAIAGAAITNNESNYGVVSIRGWQAALYGSTPYEQSELHRSRSPLSHVHKVHTPVLLLHGENDEDVPVEQSIEFYTALKYFKTPVECVIYPREPHSFQEKAHQSDMAKRIINWLARYLDLSDQAE